MHGAYMALALLHASANSCIHSAGRRNVVIACTSAVGSHLGLDLDDFGCQEPILKLDDVGLPFCCPAVLNKFAALDFSLPFSGVATLPLAAKIWQIVGHRCCSLASVERIAANDLLSSNICAHGHATKLLC